MLVLLDLKLSLLLLGGVRRVRHICDPQSMRDGLLLWLLLLATQYDTAKASID